MIELIFLLIVIPYRVRVLAKERNESALKWSFAAIGAWIGAELVVGVLIALVLNMLARAGVVLSANLLFLIVIYLLVLAAAAIGATLVIRQLRKRPIPAEVTTSN